jgi:Heterokaryon incompatibility protein (HET)
MLKKSTIEQFKLGLPIELLPKTIRDAIDITKRLDMSLIWVDRLCIIQDDVVDWQNEAAKMGSVYENAIFTIAAVGAHTPEEGCFLPREDETSSVAILPTERGNLKISRPLAPMNEELNVREFELEMSRSRWATRAWTFQERLFSRRIVYYGKRQITWECRTYRENEARFGFDAGFKYRCSKFLHTSDPKTTMNSAIRRLDREMTDFSNLWTDAEHSADWEGLIAMYSQLNLTYERDRIPAIQSLMHHVSESSGLECCAGMWLGSLPRTLFWWPIWWDESEVERGIYPRRIFRPLANKGMILFPPRLDDQCIHRCNSPVLELACCRMPGLVLFLDQSRRNDSRTTEIHSR